MSESKSSGESKSSVTVSELRGLHNQRNHSKKMLIRKDIDEMGLMRDRFIADVREQAVENDDAIIYTDTKVSMSEVEKWFPPEQGFEVFVSYYAKQHEYVICWNK